MFCQWCVECRLVAGDMSTYLCSLQTLDQSSDTECTVHQSREWSRLGLSAGQDSREMTQGTMFLFLFKTKYRRKRWSSPVENLLCVIIVMSCMSRTSSSSGPEAGVVLGERSICDSCYNGDCLPTTTAQGETYKCQCWEGWRGDKCHLCGGKVKLKENGSQNWLAEAEGNYTTNMKCTWVVEAARAGARIRLHIKDFETECGWDHLYIWDGDNIFTGLQVSQFIHLSPYLRPTDSYCRLCILVL